MRRFFRDTLITNHDVVLKTNRNLRRSINYENLYFILLISMDLLIDFDVWYRGRFEVKSKSAYSRIGNVSAIKHELKKSTLTG